MQKIIGPKDIIAQLSEEQAKELLLGAIGVIMGVPEVVMDALETVVNDSRVRKRYGKEMAGLLKFLDRLDSSIDDPTLLN